MHASILFPLLSFPFLSVISLSLHHRPAFLFANLLLNILISSPISPKFQTPNFQISLTLTFSSLSSSSSSPLPSTPDSPFEIKLTIVPSPLLSVSISIASQHSR
ncbi:hypothetical protein OCU04_008967 [Sclerotinia nivalis]|uniref:Uncharacterized protein n=1 Tax=Sclerotinia nivalis TaxID=352851 RepID=A0A9X0AGK8_9HELO|nr:hypothetical protein OCU04_008967 [Sclerotinia nivalis]